MRIFFIVLKPLRQPRFVAEVAAITLTMTSFPDLARIISDFKLLHTEVGKIALSSTIINDISTWFLFNGTIITSNGIGYEVAIMKIPYIAFVVICVFVLRPSIGWFINRAKKKGGKYSDTHVYFILIGVVIFGCVADACGLHSLVGGYIFGIIIPRGELAINVMERSEKFVTGIMLSSFLICSGLRTQFDYKEIQANWETLICIITFATSAKIVNTSIVACFGQHVDGYNGVNYSVHDGFGIINLLQVSNSTQRSPISFIAVHLVKLTKAAPLLIVHDTPDNNSGRGNTKLDHIITAFKDYKDMNEAVSVYPLTAVSPYPTMHEDIFRLAEDKDVTIILIPFPSK
ncbi:hypothetical protein Pint_02020 [Pistacia integerrima]|uniref:Uncharacterized protein n=1 Tax=Pistacia integerrima TaxID=434235 RepID=A0ACC0ZL60_9ROSI|nr:hypothetical protein Pint_02020 [Pistacia integerrima]